MDEIWTLVVVCLGVVCSSVPGSTQDSSRTLFVISGPEVMHAGTPTSLAVTVLADFSVRVMAEVAHGDTKIAQTEDFQGGLTKVLTLPPFPGSISHNSPLTLTVNGYREDVLLFTNTTTLGYSSRNVSILTQTSGSRHQPGDTVRIRIVLVQLDNRPYKGRVDISVKDPTGNVVDRWESIGDPGIVLREFTLSQDAPLGQWAITATVNGVTDEEAFIVEHYEHPPFEVLLKTPSQVLAGEDISGSVRALYPSGQPVHGTLAISISDAASPFMLTQNKEIYGSTHFIFSKNLLHETSSYVYIAACVTDSSTGSKVNKTVKAHIMTNTVQLHFHNFPPTLMPGLHFSTKLKISRYDREPLSSQDLEHSAVIEVTEKTSTVKAEPTTLILPVPEDGDVHIEFELQDQVEMLFIWARFQSSEETLTVYNNYLSPSGSYIQISPVSLPAQIGSPLQIDVRSTFEPAKLHFVVSSRGQVIDAGTGTSSSFTLTPAASWSPEACVTVYSILSDGEVSLSWSQDKAQPGEQVSLTVTAPEPRFQVGIVVMKGDDEALQADLDVTVEQECNIWMLTNARLYKKRQLEGPKNEGDVLMVEKYWSHLMDVTEPLLWFDTSVSGNKWTSEEIIVPDGVTSLRAVAVVMSDNLGLVSTPLLHELAVSKDFSLSPDVPEYLIRGEEIVLEVNIINHLDHDIEVMVLLAHSEAFEFVLAENGDISVVNAQKLIVGSYVSAAALFPIRVVYQGEMDISVDAVSAGASASHVCTVLVKPEGVEQSLSKTLFLEMAAMKHNLSRSVSFPFPPDVVPGSQRAHMALVGDILALSIHHLDSLLHMPRGCGDQNMIYFAPSIYVLWYMDKAVGDNQEIKSRALGYMMEGYRRQLSYQRHDGSFSAFGDSDSSGSIWLTAFVLRCFIQAQPYMQIDQGVLTRALLWLLEHQGPQGEFSEVGRLIHTEMQEELDDGPVALTAYVLIALLEDMSYAERYPGNVSLAQTYLENKVSSGVVSNYSLCLVAYALALANSPGARTVLDELSRRADYRDGAMVWTSSAGQESHDGQPRSAQIEMTSYVLLAHYRRGSLEESFVLLKWLSKQRNHLGGFGTTQDTVVALQALAYYAAFSGASAINLSLNISAPSPSFVWLFYINSTNYLSYESREISAEKDIHLNIYMEGGGFSIFQMNIFYNLESRAFSQDLQHTRDKEAFSLDVDVIEDGDLNHMLISICIGLKNNQVISHTGMVILEVGMLSGFSLSPAAVAPPHLIRKVEKLPAKVILYLDSLKKSTVCIRLPVIRIYKVTNIQDAMVHAYDSSEPTRKASRTYNSAVLHNMKPCGFCGVNCYRCRPGITITVPSPPSHSIRSTTYSFICLFLGISAFYFVV